MTDENVVKPNVLYKYGKFNEYTGKIFTHNEIYFSLPEEFNDPFDSKLHLTFDGTKQERKRYFFKMYQKKYRKRSRKEISACVKKIMTERKDEVILKKTLKTSTELLRKKFCICCFSKKKDNILMWAHYAEQHTGFCLEFDIGNEFFTRTLKVEYTAMWPELNVLRLDSQPEGEVGKKLLIKADDWQYEQEWRIVERVKSKRTQNFPEEALSGVILGCRISEENRENVFEWCMKRNHPPTLYEAREKQKEFGLDIIKIT